MLWLREILAAHQLLLALFHGQAFFTLGLSVIVSARRSARLRAAPSLLSLAVFGFCEALMAWSPVWATSTGAAAPWLAWLRLLLLGLGYAALLACALQTHTLLGKPQWLRGALGAGLLLLWLSGLIIARAAGVPASQVRLYGEIAARYALALPGGLIAAWGLCRHAYRSLEPRRLRLVRPQMRVTGIALGVFGLVAGLIGPAAPFFPTNWLNQDRFLQATGIPPSFLLGLCGVAIVVGVVSALKLVLNEIELWLEGVERTQALARERERIGRELHDGIIQSIYAAGLILEGARQSISQEPEVAQTQLTRAIQNLNQTIQDIRHYIFDLRGELPSEDLETGLNKMVKDLSINTLLQTEFVVEGAGPRPLGAERRQHIFQLAHEALANVARHAQARHVKVRLHYGVNALQLNISDDGVGLKAWPIHRGQGLRNIRERARLLDGMLDVDTGPGKGMTLILTVPY